MPTPTLPTINTTVLLGGNLIVHLASGAVAWFLGARVGFVTARPYYPVGWLGVLACAQIAFNLPHLHYRLFGFNDAPRPVVSFSAPSLGTITANWGISSLGRTATGLATRFLTTVVIGVIWGLVRLVTPFIFEEIWEEPEARGREIATFHLKFYEMMHVINTNG